jgi:hypothetical protein
MASLADDLLPDVIPLSKKERLRKEELEEIVQAGLEEFLKVGAALSEIRNKRLYRTEAATFEQYVQTKFGLHRARVDALIRSSVVAKSLLDNGITLPPDTKEGVVRPLCGLPDARLQAVAWQFIQSIAPERQSQPLVSRICRVIKNALDGIDENEEESSLGGHHKRASTCLPERERAFVAPILRLSSWQGFSIELVVSHASHLETARSLYLACGVMIGRCVQVQQRLASNFPALIQ